MTLEEQQELQLAKRWEGVKGKTTLRTRDWALSNPFLDPALPACSSTAAAADDLVTSLPRITVSPPATKEEHEHHQIGKPSPLGLSYPQPNWNFP
ncbi:hypothetical protein PGTUg99_013144 [Puccinia graminis f. sp. tritici]|uniref:Uncharacterized protein n=1 Tax=Puccinia graminis f. sp. tritici TaxID=56615 RepID=A0A5B0SBL4_PUCGR|nr:hypothetical protein PGTUg99_013144 [Puccinia graminis f. sp. tritici]